MGVRGGGEGKLAEILGCKKLVHVRACAPERLCSAQCNMLQATTEMFVAQPHA